MSRRKPLYDFYKASQNYAGRKPKVDYSKEAVEYRRYQREGRKIIDKQRIEIAMNETLQAYKDDGRFEAMTKACEENMSRRKWDKKRARVSESRSIQDDMEETLRKYKGKKI